MQRDKIISNLDCGRSPQQAITCGCPPFPGGGLVAIHSSCHSNPLSFENFGLNFDRLSKSCLANHISHFVML